MFGEIVFSQHAPTGVSIYASGGHSHRCYDDAVGVALFEEPQLLAVNLVPSIGSPALTEHFLVDVLPLPDLRSFTSGGGVFSLVGIADLRPGDLLGGTQAPLVHVPLDVLHRDSRVPGPSSVSLSRACDRARQQ